MKFKGKELTELTKEELIVALEGLHKLYGKSKKENDTLRKQIKLLEVSHKMSKTHKNSDYGNTFNDIFGNFYKKDWDSSWHSWDILLYLIIR